MSIQPAWEACDKTDTLFILVCSVFCWLIIPAVGLACSGYSTRFNSLASFYPGLLAVAVCSLQWWMIGYSLAYSDGNAFIGGLSKAFHVGVLAEPVGTIPEVLFSEFQLIFCATVCAIAIGGACERGHLLPLIPFTFVRLIAIPYVPLREAALALSMHRWRTWSGPTMVSSLDSALSISLEAHQFTSAAAQRQRQ